jgi:hypothetical protein
MIHKMSKKVLKRLPPSICKAAEYLQDQSLKCPIEKISVAELSRIMSVLLRTGKTNKQIIDLLIDVVNGKENELSNFVKNYPRKVHNPFNESFVMLIFGFLVTLILFQGVMYEGFYIAI